MTRIPAILLLLAAAAPALAMPFPIGDGKPDARKAGPPAVRVNRRGPAPVAAEEFIGWRRRAQARHERIREQRRRERAVALVEDRLLRKDEEAERIAAEPTEEGTPHLGFLTIVLIGAGFFVLYLLSRRLFSGPPGGRREKRKHLEPGRSRVYVLRRSP